MVKVVGRVGFGIVVLLALFGIMSVLGRFTLTTTFLATGETGHLNEFEERYYAVPYLTLAHIVPGFLFMALGPIQFMPSVRNRWLRFHRWCGRIWMLASLVAGVSALLFVTRLPVFGALSTKVGVVVASTLFLVCLVQAYRAIRRRDIAQHREWMIRTFALGLGISSFRLFIPLLMMPPIGASFVEAWDTVTWLAFVVHAVAAEVWINLTRRVPKPARATATGPRPALQVH